MYQRSQKVTTAKMRRGSEEKNVDVDVATAVCVPL